MTGQAFDDAGLVADFVQLAEIAADIGIGNLSDQAEHRSVGGKGGEQRRAGIQQARSRHHREGLRLAGRERGAERHVGRALFVPGVYRAQPVGDLEQRFEQQVVLHARQGVNRVEPVPNERGDDRFGRRHRRGRGPSRFLPFLVHFFGHSHSLVAASLCRLARLCRGDGSPRARSRRRKRLTNRRGSCGCARPFTPWRN